MDLECLKYLGSFKPKQSVVSRVTHTARLGAA